MPPTDRKLFAGRADLRGKQDPEQDQGRTRPRCAIDPRDLGSVEHDHRGDAVFQWHVRVPGRRSEDPTIDFLEALDVEGLSIEDDSDDEDLAATRNCNPYDNDR